MGFEIQKLYNVVGQAAQEVAVAKPQEEKNVFAKVRENLEQAAALIEEGVILAEKVFKVLEPFLDEEGKEKLNKARDVIVVVDDILNLPETKDLNKIVQDIEIIFA